MRFMKHTLFSLLLFLPFSVHAGESIENGVNDFALKMEKLRSLKGLFVQVISDRDGYEIQKTNGNFLLKRPGFFRWQVAPPYEQLVVGTLNELKVYDPDLEQLTIYTRREMDNTPALIMSGDIEKIKQQYDVISLGSADEQTFKLTPKDSQSAFKKIVFNFAGELLSSLAFYDQLSQKTLVTFSELKSNQNISDVEFDFVAPEGTDIIINE